MPPLLKLLQHLTDKPKPRKRLRKRPCIENKVEQGSTVEVEALNKSIMRTKNPQNQLI